MHRRNRLFNGTRTKRTAAAVFSAFLLITAIAQPYSLAYANELPPLVEETGEAGPAASIDGEGISTFSEDTPSPDDEVSEGGTASETSLAAQPNDVMSSIPSAQATSFLYVDRPVINRGEKQNIALELTEDYSDWSQASLIVEDEDGATTAFDLTRSESTLLLFAFDTGQLGNGLYRIDSLTIETLAGDVAISFEDCDIASFEVVGELPVMSANLEEDCSSESPVTVYSVDSDGNLSEEQSIEDAAAVAEQAASKGRSTTEKAGELVVALDPGHGGPDVGAIGVNNAHEADLCWKIAQYCKDALRQYEGVKVVLTRGQNENPSLKERAKRAADQKSNVLVSIHLNSSGVGAYGSEVWVPNDSSYNHQTHTVGAQLGKDILSKLTALGLNDRGVKTRDYPSGEGNSQYEDGSIADYYGIIRESRYLGMTALIVEHAFIDSWTDYNRFLSDEVKLKSLGVADAEGIAEYFGLSLEEPYAPVYDYDYYITNNPDLRAHYGDDRVAVLKHFLNYGMAEGRKSSPDFDLTSYYNANQDLRAAYGFDLKQYYMHYIKYGKGEGRKCAGVFELSSYRSSIGGKDYASVYDGACYRSENPDLSTHYTKKKGSVSLFDDGALLKHFLDYGMAEGRKSSPDFDLTSYYNANQDLRAAYKMNLKSYYDHYLKYGKKEGRTCLGVEGIRSYQTVCRGMEYSAVYDGAYYRESNADLDSAFTRSKGAVKLFDDGALIDHFVRYGMAEGRSSSKDFDVRYYRNRYPDLQEAYGSSLARYYTHYVKYGKKEGREAVDKNGSLIMGASQVSVDQMVSYYQRAVDSSTYPSKIYADKGAKTLRDFCRIVLEEANAEGVRAEVLFCQAMKETGWLRFGGSVKAEQCNFGGIGATSATVGGATFPDVRTGLRAQVQHLKAYASHDALINVCVDPRFDFVKRGSAPLITDLNGKWAVPGNGYGEDILYMIASLKSK